jgi:hypothetical protein
MRFAAMFFFAIFYSVEPAVSQFSGAALTNSENGKAAQLN